MDNKKNEVKPFRIIYKLIGLIFPILYFFFSKLIVLSLIFFFLVLYSIYDYERLTNKKFNKWLFKNVNFLLKKKEKTKISTAVWLLLGSFIVILLFNKEIAVVSLFMFTFGDAAGNIFGSRFRKIKIFDKSLEGHIFVLTFSLLFGFAIGNYFELEFYRVFAGALASTFIQVFPIKIDDNLTMPILAGVVMSVI